MPILRRTLEEARKAASGPVSIDSTSTFEKDAASQERSAKSSKKRKRSENVAVEMNPDSKHNLADLMEAIFATLHYAVQSSNPISGTLDEGRSNEFFAEQMKTIIRTSANESAIILGSWLHLCYTIVQFPNGAAQKDMNNWLAPFIEVWQSHLVDIAPALQFSLHATSSLLALLQVVKAGSFPVEWISTLEALAARNIIIPAKVAKIEDADSDLLSRLVSVNIIQDVSNSSQILEIAIRSVHTQGSKRRKIQDETWLQTVFTTLKDAMPKKPALPNGEQVRAMLESAVEHKLSLDLSILRSITAEFALPDGREDWKLLSTLIKLDANVFLILNNNEDLLLQLLSRITKASIQPSWFQYSEDVVTGVLLPLMKAFSSARDLSGFINHWYSQLVEFEILRKTGNTSLEQFSAWEDDALQTELRTLLEASLTVHQITQITDMLRSRVKENPEAVCVMLDAISGAIHREEVADAVNLVLCDIMFDDGYSEKLDSRYMWRSRRIVTKSLVWLNPAEVDALPSKWKDHNPVFVTQQPNRANVKSNGQLRLDAVESMRCVFAAWTAARKGGLMRTLLRDRIIELLEELAADVKSFLDDLQSGEGPSSETVNQKQSSFVRSYEWMVWSMVRCLFVDYPTTLEYVPYPYLQGHTDSSGLPLTRIETTSSSNCYKTYFCYHPPAGPQMPLVQVLIGFSIISRCSLTYGCLLCAVIMSSIMKHSSVRIKAFGSLLHT